MFLKIQYISFSTITTIKYMCDIKINFLIKDKLMLKAHAPEWMSRLKVSDNINLHRSIDCIAKVQWCIEKKIVERSHTLFK